MLSIEIRNRVKTLLEAIEKVEVGVEARTAARELDSGIDELLESNGKNADAVSLLRKAKGLEEKVAKKHPAAANILGELMEALAKMIS